MNEAEKLFINSKVQWFNLVLNDLSRTAEDIQYVVKFAHRLRVVLFGVDDLYLHYYTSTVQSQSSVSFRLIYTGVYWIGEIVRITEVLPPFTRCVTKGQFYYHNIISNITNSCSLTHWAIIQAYGFIWKHLQSMISKLF